MISAAAVHVANFVNSSHQNKQWRVQVVFVCLGLAVQGLAPEPALAAGLTTAATPAPSSWSLKLLGVVFMLLSSLAYSFLGVSYDLLVRSEGPTPTHSEVMFYTAKIGMPATSLLPVVWGPIAIMALCCIATAVVTGLRCILYTTTDRGLLAVAVEPLD